VDAFRKADEVLFQAIKGISDLITQEGIVNVDFADVRAVMNSMGRALMGTGCAKGEGRARLAAQEAITSPLLDDISVDGATGVLINIVGGPDMKMREIQEAATLVQEQAHEDANIIFGATVDESMADMLKVTVIATGFDRANEEHAHLMKQASRQPMEREAPAPAPRATQHHAETAYSVRQRPPAPGLHLHAHSSAPPTSSVQSQLPHVRDRITFPSAPSQASLEHDWDIPTFQRRGSGG
jgi:cell division protein FtsZ